LDSPKALFRVCVFCGSRSGTRPEYAEAARRVGTTLAASGLGLVYGGGRIGLMGEVADAALRTGGHVVGIIPEPLALKEIAHSGVSELLVVPDMHQRKALMATRSNAFLALPGGVGTYEEFFEILTWSVLGLHAKPIGLLNIEGYFDPLLALLEHGVEEGFMKPADMQRVLVSDDAEEIVRRLPRFEPPPVGPRWIDLSQT
jgi:uncharacterized protein (TIGR00730 family)